VYTCAHTHLYNFITEINIGINFLVIQSATVMKSEKVLELGSEDLLFDLIVYMMLDEPTNTFETYMSYM